MDWDAEAVTKAIIRVYHQARAALPDPFQHRDQALVRLRSILGESDQILRVDPGTNVDAATFAASDVFRRKDPDHGRMFLVKPELLASISGDAPTLRQVIDELDKRGHLIRSSSGKSTRQVSLGGDKNRPRSRYFCIRGEFAK